MLNVIKKFDYIILIIIVALFSIGLVSLYSASQGAGGNIDTFNKQIMWFSVGIIAFLFLSFFDYKHLRHFWIPLYIIINILLIVVFRSNPNNGATSWIKVGFMSFQPAEFTKIVLIITNAFLIHCFNEKESFNKPTRLLLILIISAIPIFLIIKQPDYGTAIVLIITVATMLYLGGLKLRYIIISAILCAVLVPIAYKFILPEHAKTRIETFFNPESDPKGAGYNAIQSKLAVGSGGFNGMGFLNGSQTQLGLLPMKSTDFVFSVISEEHGFLASCGVVLLFGILLLRLIFISKNSKDEFGKLICIGVFSIFLVHFLENIGMSIGLLPITGIPLPFISYGGSSMLTNMILLGMCESVKTHQKKHNYL